MPKESLYNEHGRVDDPGIAKEMAKEEDRFHERRLFGLMKPKKEVVEHGERRAEEKGLELLQQKEREQALKEELAGLTPERINSGDRQVYAISGEVRGHQVKLLFTLGDRVLGSDGFHDYYLAYEVICTIDGKKISDDVACTLLKRWSNPLLGAFIDARPENASQRGHELPFERSPDSLEKSARNSKLGRIAMGEDFDITEILEGKL